MANDVKLQEGHPVDENLRPLKVGGQSTAIETAKSGNGARVRGDLEVTGILKGKTDIKLTDDITCDDIACDELTATHVNTSTMNNFASTDLTIDDAGSISLDATSDSTTTGLLLKNAGTLIGDITAHHAATYFRLYENGGASDADYVDIYCAANGATTIKTLDATGNAAHLTLQADGIIALDAVGGKFESKNNSTEFSVSGSAYAGMILGVQVQGINSTPATYTLTTSEALIAGLTHYVKFVAPPSGVVEIEVQINYDAGSGSATLYLGLSNHLTIGSNSLDAWFLQQVHEPARAANDQNIVHKWIATGLTAGTAYTYYLTAKSSSTLGTPKLQWGGDSVGENPVFIMKATALPAATPDYAIYS